jgi:hypothetical protein
VRAVVTNRSDDRAKWSNDMGYLVSFNAAEVDDAEVAAEVADAVGDEEGAGARSED